MEIPGYTIESVIGEGGMATVYLAVQQSLDREVALKVMSESLTSDKSFRQRFLKEGKIIAQLHHPRIVTIHDFGVYENVYYICEEYLPNGTLEDEIQHGITIPRALFIIKGVADALEYAHSHDFVHRDIKPQNILFRSDRLRSPVLTDFGIAKTLTPDQTKLTMLNAFCGSPTYSSPEQAKGLELDRRSDIYSLGIVLYQMLTGKVPFEAQDPLSLGIRHIMDPVPPLPDNLAGRFQPIIDKCLAKDPKDRYPTAEAFIQAISAIDDSRGNGLPGQATHPGAVDNVSSRETVIVRDAAARVGGATPTPAAGSDSPRPSGPQAGSDTRPPETPGPQRGKTVGYVVMATGAALAALFALRYVGDEEPPVPTVVERPAPSPTGTKDPEPWSTQSVVTPIGVEQEAVSESAEQIASMLEAAEDFVRSGQFFSPDDANAYASYKGILDIDATNLQATSGLAEVIRLQSELAKKSIANGNLAAAERLVGEIRRAAPDEPAGLTLERSLRETAERLRREEKIRKLLGAADTYEKAGQLFAPDGQNAYAALAAARAAGADDELVTQRRHTVFARQEALAEQALGERRFAKSLGLINEVLQVEPDHEGFIQLHKTASEQLDEAAREAAARSQRDKWLEEAEAHLEQGRLIDGPGDNAYSLFRQVLEAQPGNKAAIAGIDAVLAGLAKKADEAAEAGDLDGALGIVAAGLKIRPDDATLQTKRTEIEDRVTQSRRVRKLLARATEHRRALRLVTPLNNSALHAYNEVLQLEPENAEAKKGLAELVRIEEQLAVKAFDRGRLQTSLSRIKAGLSIDATDERLLALQRRVEEKIVARRQAQTRAAQKAAPTTRKPAVVTPPKPAVVVVPPQPPKAIEPVPQPVPEVEAKVQPVDPVPTPGPDVPTQPAAVSPEPKPEVTAQPTAPAPVVAPEVTVQPVEPPPEPVEPKPRPRIRTFPSF